MTTAPAPIPRLSTKRLVLRPLTLADAAYRPNSDEGACLDEVRRNEEEHRGAGAGAEKK